MNVHDSVTATIYRAIDDVNGQLPPAARLKKEPATVLFGREEGLDSLGMVNLLVSLEKHVERDLGRTVSLTDPEVLFAADSPLASVESLGRYVASLLEKD